MLFAPRLFILMLPVEEVVLSEEIQRLSLHCESIVSIHTIYVKQDRPGFRVRCG